MSDFPALAFYATAISYELPMRRAVDIDENNYSTQSMRENRICGSGSMLLAKDLGISHNPPPALLQPPAK
ncbi:MAG: hypothetical protein M1378_06455 [Bacteroidetes bacterium]|nr:hypothetical protein [Bacteroidota bacterium]